MISLKHGGKWLAAARSWIQHRFINGSTVTWGSSDILGTVTVRDIEEVAERVAEAAIKDYEEAKESAEREAQLRQALRGGPMYTVMWTTFDGLNVEAMSKQDLNEFLANDGSDIDWRTVDTFDWRNANVGLIVDGTVIQNV